MCMCVCGKEREDMEDEDGQAKVGARDGDTFHFFPFPCQTMSQREMVAESSRSERETMSAVHTRGQERWEGWREDASSRHTHTHST